MGSLELLIVLPFVVKGLVNLSGKVITKLRGFKKLSESTARGLNTMARPVPAPHFSVIRQDPAISVLNPQPVTVMSFEKDQGQDFFASEKINGLVIFGGDLSKGEEQIFLPMAKNFNMGPIGLQQKGKRFKYGVTKENLPDYLLNYHNFGDDLFIRWNTHGSINKSGWWRGYLGNNSEISMGEISFLIRQMISAGHTNHEYGYAG